MTAFFNSNHGKFMPQMATLLSLAGAPIDRQAAPARGRELRKNRAHAVDWPPF
jgi:hypothetical protein